MKIIDNKLCRENKSHFKLNGDAKTKFNTEAEAVVKCYEINSIVNREYKMVAYKCPVCNYWHIGNSKKRLSLEEKEKFVIKYKEIRIKLKVW